ncbi:MAG: S24/S26 family peptidase [Myxococcota bacterium]
MRSERSEVIALDAEHMPLLDELLAEGRVVRIRATGPSMHPFVRSGEWVWLRRTAHAPRVGDVVLVLEHGFRPLIHRVINVSPRGIQTRGDSAERQDAWISPGLIVGQVIRVEALDRSWLGSTFRALIVGRLATLRFRARTLRRLGGQAVAQLRGNR